jgi:hypothetical protein
LACDLFVVIGSSLVVYPAAGFPLLAKRNGAKLVVIDPKRVHTGLEYPVHNPHTTTDLLISALSDLPASDLYIIEGLVASEGQLPMAEKLRLKISTAHRGYMPMGDQHRAEALPVERVRGLVFDRHQRDRFAKGHEKT